MKVRLKIGSHEREVEAESRGGRIQFRLEGREVHADAMEATPGSYSILIGGRAYEARVETQLNGLRIHVGSREYVVEIIDPRKWRRERTGLSQAEGCQQIVAPMPGKIVRLLVKTGDSVEVGQGLVVVEAMKMQNEIKSPKSGAVERLLVREGQPVSAGDALIVIT